MPRDPQRTREKLLATAAAQFCAAGFHGTDTNRIARGAGFAPQTFYRHFEDKRAIFLEVYRQWSAELLDRVRAADGTAATIASIVAHHRRWGPFRASLMALHAADPVVAEARVAERKRQLRTLREATGMSSPRVLHLMWCIERVADGIALGEAKAMRVSERDLVAILVEQLDAAADARADGPSPAQRR